MGKAFPCVGRRRRDHPCRGAPKPVGTDRCAARRQAGPSASRQPDLQHWFRL